MSERTQQDDLVGYGFGEQDLNSQPPLVRRKVIVRSPTTGKIAGFIGVEGRRGNGTRVYTALRTGYHFFYDGGGYAISDSILDELAEKQVARILIHEGTEADDDVYEFPLRAYTQQGTPIPESQLEDEDDPQTYIELEEHMHKWENHAADLFTQDFGRACDRIIDKRGWD